MHVLLVTADKSVLSDKSSVSKELEELSEKVERLFVIALTSEPSREPRKVSDKLWIFPAHGNPLDAVFESLKVARKELLFQRVFQADLVVASDEKSAIVAGFLIAKRYRRPIQIAFKDEFFEYGGSKLKAVFNSGTLLLAFKYATRLQVASAQSLEALAARNPLASSKADVVLPQLNAAYLQNETIEANLREKYPTFRFLLLMVSPLEPAYNVPYALEVVAAALRQYRHIGLIIVGDGSGRRTIMARAEALGIKDYVMIESPSGPLSSYFKTAHGFLVTSTRDAYAHTLQEAAACGCAILTSPVPGASFLKNGESACIVELKDPEGFVGCLNNMIMRPGFRESLKLNALQAFESLGSQDERPYAERVIEAWQRTIDAFKVAAIKPTFDKLTRT